MLEATVLLKKREMLSSSDVTIHTPHPKYNYMYVVKCAFMAIKVTHV